MNVIRTYLASRVLHQPNCLLLKTLQARENEWYRVPNEAYHQQLPYCPPNSWERIWAYSPWQYKIKSANATLRVGVFVVISPLDRSKKKISANFSSSPQVCVPRSSSAEQVMEEEPSTNGSCPDVDDILLAEIDEVQIFCITQNNWQFWL